MKYRKLARLVRRQFGGNPYLLGWNAGGGEISYNIVTLPHGVFTVLAASGRGDWYRRADSDGLPVAFTSQADVCDFVWASLNRPRPEPVARTPRTPEQIESQRLQTEATRAALASRTDAPGAPPYPDAATVSAAVHTYFRPSDRATGMKAVVDSATEGTAPLLVAAVERVFAEVEGLPIDPALAGADRFRALFQRIGQRYPEFDTESVVLLAERWLSASGDSTKVG